ncbi:MAG: HAD family hydrolase [Selenomonadaceae bacterium]|nr:HAD family hydrolase [Selenomonadaceae bacterium]
MSIKIVFSDIDGTFLTNDHKVTKQTKSAVKSLLAQDIPFVLVSARMPEAIYPITDKIGIKIPIISYSGGLVLTVEEEVLYSKTIVKEQTEAVLKAIDEGWNDVTVNYYAGRRWFVRDVKDKRVKYEMDITEATAESADFSDLISSQVMPNKILIMCEESTCEEMERELGKMFPALNVVRSSKFLLEIMDKSVSKATGIEVMLKHYGLTAAEAIGFGDNYNDIDMFKLVGTAVVMGNAPEPVKQYANEVTTSNEDSGIYQYLIKHGVISLIDDID